MLTNQKGSALIIVAVLLVAAASTFLVSNLDANRIKIARNKKLAEALAEAKFATISNVVSGGSGAGVGVFPCSEDISKIGFSTEGQAGNSCSNTLPSIGRLAWKTLGEGGLQDGNTDKLWYVLSPGFRAAPINSNSVGTLSLNGIPNQAIAVLLSSGTILSGQSRPIPSPTVPPVVSDYLDGENGDSDADFVDAVTTSSYNDTLLSIGQKDIFPILEKRVLGEFANYLNAYKAVWGRFPFPAPFGNPTTATYIGNSALTGGFLPVSNSSPSTTWNTATTPTPAIVSPPGNTVSAPACTFRTANTRIRCDVTISLYNSSNPPTLSILGVVNNIGSGFYDGFTDIYSNTSNDVRVTTLTGSATVASASRVVSHNLNAVGQGGVTFSGTLANTGIVRIEYRRTPPLSNWVLAATNHYLLANNWHQLVYYKAATPYLPGGVGSCGVCLTVNQISPSFTTTKLGVHALLMSSGWRLDSTDYLNAPTYNASNPAQLRPNGILSAYFDSANNTTAGLTFDNKYLTSTFNDQVRLVEYD